MFNIVMVEPEIPSNTGNIARTCAITGCKLHLIKPLGFLLDNKHLKRAGLDYWEMLNVQIYENLEDFFSKNEGNFYLATTKANHCYSEKKYRDNDYFLFGKETKGLPEELIKDHQENSIKIPMLDNPHARSLNLSNSVAIIIYEALRQNDFFVLKK